MAIRLADNPFKGVNPLLNSILQGDHYYAKSNLKAPSVWPSFHSQHIVHLTDALNQQLRPLGYVAFSEQGLQIQPGETILQPDSTVYDGLPDRSGSSVRAAVQPELMRIPVAKIVAMRIPPIRSANIYPIPQGHPILGNPITRIELLSPANKRSGSYYQGYVSNRAEALDSGTALIEIDYLHESVAPFPENTVPRYPNATNSFPYYVAVTNMRAPDPAAIIHPFNVDEPIPFIDVPLAGQEIFSFDLNAVYQHTFNTSAWPALLDYSENVEREKSYNPQDRAKIASKLEAIRAAQPT